MKKYNLKFISDENLFNHVKEIVEKYRFEINLQKFNKNLLDPIKLTFDSKIYNKDLKDIIEGEIIRQIDKSNTNHIGYFHQNIFKYLEAGWSVPDKGFDVVNSKKKIFVEMKNKHNTMNSSSAQKTYMRMLAKINENGKAICMLVEVIAKNSQNVKWVTILDGNSVSDERIRKISIDKFYEMVTGDKDAFKRVCEVLLQVIDDVIKSKKVSIIKNTVFSELEKLSPKLLKSIYLLSFKKYEGFDTLKM
jgi:hypothetical protein